MTEANRINANFRGLTVHNQNNNILRMEQDGNFSLTTGRTLTTDTAANLISNLGFTVDNDSFEALFNKLCMYIKKWINDMELYR